MRQDRSTRLALTVWEGRISPVFDVFREALILDLVDGRVVSRARSLAPDVDPVDKVRHLAEVGADVLVCGAISEPVRHALTTKGVRVIGFVAGDVDAVVEAFVAGRLPCPELVMPGCCGRTPWPGRKEEA